MGSSNSNGLVDQVFPPVRWEPAQGRLYPRKAGRHAGSATGVSEMWKAHDYVGKRNWIWVTTARFRHDGLKSSTRVLRQDRPNQNQATITCLKVDATPPAV